MRARATALATLLVATATTITIGSALVSPGARAQAQAGAVTALPAAPFISCPPCDALAAAVLDARAEVVRLAAEGRQIAADLAANAAAQQAADRRIAEIDAEIQKQENTFVSTPQPDGSTLSSRYDLATGTIVTTRTLPGGGTEELSRTPSRYLQKLLEQREALAREKQRLADEANELMARQAANAAEYAAATRRLAELEAQLGDCIERYCSEVPSTDALSTGESTAPQDGIPAGIENDPDKLFEYFRGLIESGNVADYNDEIQNLEQDADPAVFAEVMRRIQAYEAAEQAELDQRRVAAQNAVTLSPEQWLQNAATILTGAYLQLPPGTPLTAATAAGQALVRSSEYYQQEIARQQQAFDVLVADLRATESRIRILSANLQSYEAGMTFWGGLDFFADDDRLDYLTTQLAAANARLPGLRTEVVVAGETLEATIREAESHERGLTLAGVKADPALLAEAYRTRANELVALQQELAVSRAQFVAGQAEFENVLEHLDMLAADNPELAEAYADAKVKVQDTYVLWRSGMEVSLAAKGRAITDAYTQYMNDGIGPTNDNELVSYLAGCGIDPGFALFGRDPVTGQFLPGAFGPEAAARIESAAESARDTALGARFGLSLQYTWGDWAYDYGDAFYSWDTITGIPSHGWAYGKGVGKAVVYAVYDFGVFVVEGGDTLLETDQFYANQFFKNTPLINQLGIEIDWFGTENTEAGGQIINWLSEDYTGNVYNATQAGLDWTARRREMQAGSGNSQQAVEDVGFVTGTVGTVFVGPEELIIRATARATGFGARGGTAAVRAGEAGSEAGAGVRAAGAVDNVPGPVTVAGDVAPAGGVAAGRAAGAAPTVDIPTGPDAFVPADADPAGFLRNVYGDDSPAARAYEIAVEEFGADNVGGIAGSYARGEARAIDWPQGTTHAQAGGMDKAPLELADDPSIFQLLPPQTQQLVTQARELEAAGALPSDLDLAVGVGDRDRLLAVGQRIFDETGVYVEFTPLRSGQGAAAQADNAAAAAADAAAAGGDAARFGDDTVTPLNPGRGEGATPLDPGRPRPPGGSGGGGGGGGGGSSGGGAGSSGGGGGQPIEIDRLGLTGETLFIREVLTDRTLVLGPQVQINTGAVGRTTLYRHPNNPNLVIKLTDPEASELNRLGAAALEGADPSAVRAPPVYNTYQVTSGDFAGYTLQVVAKAPDDFDSVAARAIKTASGDMTTGQQVALGRFLDDMGSRGWGVADLKSNNITFWRTGPDDDWVVIAIDPNMYVPFKTPEAARAFNAAILDPPARYLDGPWVQRVQEWQVELAARFDGDLDVDRMRDLGVTGYNTLAPVEGGFPFNPRIGQEFPSLRSGVEAAEESSQVVPRTLRPITLLDSPFLGTPSAGAFPPLDAPRGVLIGEPPAWLQRMGVERLPGALGQAPTPAACYPAPLPPGGTASASTGMLLHVPVDVLRSTDFSARRALDLLPFTTSRFIIGRCTDGDCADAMGVMALSFNEADADRVMMAVADLGLPWSGPDELRGKRVPPDDSYLRSRGSWGQSGDDQWGLKAVGLDAAALERAWNRIPADAEPVVVAVIDTGIAWNHRDMGVSQLWVNRGEVPANGVDDDANGYVDDVAGWNFVNQNNLPWDLDGHGTLVAGIIAAAAGNAHGVAGVNPYARVMNLKALDSVGNARASYLAEAITYAANNGADIINLSVGGPRLTPTEQLALDYAASRGVLVVAAAGNEGEEIVDQAPVSAPGVLVVAATDAQNRRPAWSNWGAAVRLSAPGVDILGPRAIRTDTMGNVGRRDYQPEANVVGPNRGYYRADGTSFSAPFVAGVASLLLAANPTLTAVDLQRMLLQNAADVETPGVDQFTGYGLLDANAALAATPQFFVDASISGVAVVQREGRPAVEVQGTANADRFARAWIEIGAGDNPDRWTRSSEPLQRAVTAGALGWIDARELTSSRQWTLRLMTEHQNGRRREARFLLNLQ